MVTRPKVLAVGRASSPRSTRLVRSACARTRFQNCRKLDSVTKKTARFERRTCPAGRCAAARARRPSAARGVPAARRSCCYEGTAARSAAPSHMWIPRPAPTRVGRRGRRGASRERFCARSSSSRTMDHAPAGRARNRHQLACVRTGPRRCARRVCVRHGDFALVAARARTAPRRSGHGASTCLGSLSHRSPSRRREPARHAARRRGYAQTRGDRGGVDETPPIVRGAMKVRRRIDRRRHGRRDAARSLDVDRVPQPVGRRRRARGWSVTEPTASRASVT